MLTPSTILLLYKPISFRQVIKTFQLRVGLYVIFCLLTGNKKPQSYILHLYSHSNNGSLKATPAFLQKFLVLLGFYLLSFSSPSAVIEARLRDERMKYSKNNVLTVFLLYNLFCTSQPLKKCSSFRSPSKLHAKGTEICKPGKKNGTNILSKIDECTKEFVNPLQRVTVKLR